MHFWHWETDGDILLSAVYLLGEVNELADALSQVSSYELELMTQKPCVFSFSEVRYFDKRSLCHMRKYSPFPLLLFATGWGLQ